MNASIEGKSKNVREDVVGDAKGGRRLGSNSHGECWQNLKAKLAQGNEEAGNGINYWVEENDGSVGGIVGGGAVGGGAAVGGAAVAGMVAAAAAVGQPIDVARVLVAERLIHAVVVLEMLSTAEFR